LKQQVSQKYQSHVEASIAGYLFLRLFNPAIVVPDGVDIKPAGGESIDRVKYATQHILSV
jgi:hypothetical protein